MKTSAKTRIAFVAAILSLIPALASTSATQRVTFSVTGINEISLSGNPGAMTISTGTAGAAPTSVTDSSTLYAVTTNSNNGKITAAIDSAMPAGVTLTITLAAPTGASSAGQVSLSTTAANVVTGAGLLNDDGKSITYTLSTTPAAGVVPPQSRTVILTVTAGAI